MHRLKRKGAGKPGSRYCHSTAEECAAELVEGANEALLRRVLTQAEPLSNFARGFALKIAQ